MAGIANITSAQPTITFSVSLLIDQPEVVAAACARFDEQCSHRYAGAEEVAQADTGALALRRSELDYELDLLPMEEDGGELEDELVLILDELEERGFFN